jgi:hypothetical protein
MTLPTIRRITSANDLEGRTIVRSRSAGESIQLLLDDGSVYAAEAKPSYEHSAELDETAELFAYQLQHLGLMTSAEVDAHHAGERAESERARLELEREQFERLKAKFEGGGS